MTASQTRPADIERLVARHLDERDTRFTAARRLVVRTLSGAAGPMTAAELHEVLRHDVPLSSLYRTLTVLEDGGILHREHDPAGTARYELSEWLAGHHHHLVCTRCSTVVDVSISNDLERQVVQIVGDLAAGHDWTATDHRIDIEGVCPQCRTR